MSDDHGPKIRVMKDGPYLVDGAVRISPQVIEADADGECVAWREGEPVPERRSCALCRCGESNAKPYCDGSHRTVGFDGTETAAVTPYLDAATRIEGPVVDLLDDLTLCSEARFCAARGTAWRLVERDDPEAAKIVVEEACLCPSGRYTAADKATGEVIEPVLPVSVGLVEDPSQGVSGPIWLRGGIPVEGSVGVHYEVRNRVTLCRCGESRNKPFCDAKHVEIGFDASE